MTKSEKRERSRSEKPVMMKKKSDHNSLYFVRDLYQSGLDLEVIAKGSRLPLELIKKIYIDTDHCVDENQFNQLLGFYCYHLCQTQYTQQWSSRLKDFKKIFEKKDQYNEEGDFLNRLSQKPWLNRKRLLLKNTIGKEVYLTLRQQELLYYFLQGKTHIQVAVHLNISKRTVQYHWQRMRECLNITVAEQVARNWRIESY